MSLFVFFKAKWLIDNIKVWSAFYPMAILCSSKMTHLSLQRGMNESTCQKVVMCDCVSKVEWKLLYVKKNNLLCDCVGLLFLAFWSTLTSVSLLDNHRPEPAISDDLITNHFISLNTFLFHLLCLRLCFK